MKTDRKTPWILIALLAGCGAAPLPAEDATVQAAQALDGVTINPRPPLAERPTIQPFRVQAERLVWTRETTIEIWALDQWGSVISKRSLTRPGPSWWAMGTAGDRLLVARADSPESELWTLDSSNNFVSSVSLSQPSSSFRATGLSVEMSPGATCYRRGNNQNYWLTFDEPVTTSDPTKDMLVRTIGGDGFTIQTEQIAKPAWMTAYAFGLGPDDHTHVLFRDFGTFAGGTIYDADWVTGTATTLGHYTLVAPGAGLGYLHVSGFQPTSLALWKVPPLTIIWGGGSGRGERMLLTSFSANSAGNDRAQLGIFDDVGTLLSTTTYELTGRGFATAYTWLPPLCP
jgi:hypothetical protein